MKNNEEQYFVQLGLRNNKGRIVKNETYKLDDFLDKVFPYDFEYPIITRTFWFDRVFNTKKYKKMIRARKQLVEINVISNTLHDIFNNIIESIDEDVKGKKRK